MNKRSHSVLLLVDRQRVMSSYVTAADKVVPSLQAVLISAFHLTGGQFCLLLSKAGLLWLMTDFDLFIYVLLILFDSRIEFDSMKLVPFR